MRNIFVFLLFAALLAAMLPTNSCSKSTENVEEPAYDELSLMADRSVAAMESFEAVTTEEGGIYIPLEGIAPDFLLDETYLDESFQAPANDTLNRNLVIRHSFLRCLKKAGLTETQLPAVRIALHTYKECKEGSLQKARAMYKRLQEKYKAKAARLWSAYYNGTLSKEELKASLAELRQQFKKELRELHLKEKLHQALHRCLRLFFKDLKQILTEEQWSLFKRCTSAG